jgi:hypothetical protein
MILTIALEMDAVRHAKLRLVTPAQAVTKWVEMSVTFITSLVMMATFSTTMGKS